MYFYSPKEQCYKKNKMKRRKRKIPELPKSLQSPLTEKRGTVMFDSHIHINMIFNLAILGHTESEMAKVIGISTSTLSKWKERFPEVLDAIHEGKDEADGKVANALYQVAIGYSHEDVQILTNRVKVKDERGKVIEERTEPLIVPVTKYYPPNVRAAIKFLQVRQPGRWSERTEVSGNITHSHKVDLSGLSIEELKVLKKLSDNGINSAPPVVEEAEAEIVYQEMEDEDFRDLVDTPLKKYENEDE
jgi:hypothetical protein